MDYFELSFEELMSIKVTTAGKTPEEIRDIPASVVVISRREIEAHGYQSLGEILENIPGLFGINDYEYNDLALGVRGFWNGVANANIIILLNGMQQVDDFQGNYPPIHFPVPVEAIDRIEVVRGPMSVFYGSGAFFGAINVFTDGSETEPVQMITASAGSLGNRRLFLRLQDHKAPEDEDAFHYTLNLSTSSSGGFDYSLADMVSDVSTLPGYGVPIAGRTGGQMERNRKYLDFSAGFKGFSLRLKYNENHEEVFFLMPSFSEGNDRRVNALSFRLGYRRPVNRWLTLDGEVSYHFSRNWTVFDYLGDRFYGMQQIESRRMDGELNAFLKPCKELNIVVGGYAGSILQVSSNYNLPSFGSPTLVNNYYYLPGEERLNTFALYAQADLQPLPFLKLVAGLRLEWTPSFRLEGILAGGTEYATPVEKQYEPEKVRVIPRLAVIVPFTSEHMLKILFGKAIKRPSFFQNAGNNLLANRLVLEPERIRTLEFNYIGSFFSSVTFNGSIFFNNLENLITRVVEFDENNDYTTWSANAGEMVTRGVELTLYFQLSRRLELEMSGTFQKTEDKREGYEDIEPAYSPDVLGYVKAAYRHKRLTLALTGRYVAGMETLWDETAVNPDGSFGKRIGRPVPGYFNLDANLRLEDFPARTLFMNLKVSNLLDEVIRYPTFTNNAWADLGTLGPGRIFLLTLGWNI